MNSKNTWLWVALAGGLFAFIFFFERNIQKPEMGPPKVFPSLKTEEIKSIRVQSRGQKAIQAVRTNGGWQLTEPLHYPAQALYIEGLLQALQQLTAMPYISGPDLKAIPEPDTEFGFDSPQCSLLLDQKRYLILIGRRTPPGDQVYLQIVGVEGVFVVDARLLRMIPRSASDWRETMLANWPQITFDRIVVTNAGKLLDLQLNRTNRLWRMVSPNDVRADTSKIHESLKQLADIRVQEFVTDEPNPDLEGFGLQPPELSLIFLQSTNTVLRMDFGRSPTNDSTLVFARRGDQSNVVTVPKTFIEPWSSSHSHDFRDFLDPHLVALPRPPDQIEVRGTENFSLERDKSGSWRVLPAGYLADSNLMAQVFVNLTNLQVTAEQIEKDIVPAPDLPKYGLAQPYREYILRASPETGDLGASAVLSQLAFGTNQDKIFARVAGESFVYSMDPGVLNLLPSAGWQMRDRRIWHFALQDVAAVTIQQGQRTRQLLRKGEKNWALAPGSQGIMDEIISAQIEEAVFRLSDLSAAFWVQRGDANLETYGFSEADYRITVELNNGEKHSVEFGKDAPSNFPFAATTIEGETWVFEFPWTIYQFVQMYLNIPANVP